MPRAYKISAPISEPIVAAITTPIIDNEVVVVMNPLIVRIISDGSGGKTFSRAISKAIAK